ncbi:hypothetical protein DYB30_013070 [Aphanomyces astaci]|uniref:Farnesoic acid O-methyl transferase domain-containing protein n=1 Tax=Aphanomyces astaci TaxID=112090 RepID=A0A397E792_APHAT|nr:hypothetical protein DYB30_013070 [Aphanomyces astaci]RHZ39416.1 hypothetical protein DYB26_014418 [Aphanomyces astaci]
MEVDTTTTEAAVEVQDEVPREVSIEDADIGAQFGRVLKWTDLGIHLHTDKVNAVTLTLDTLTQQELQVHVRALIDGHPWSYEFLCGGQGNTEASVLKRGVKGKEVDVACTFCGRICSDTTAGHYWFHVSVHPESGQERNEAIQISMGVGSVVGDKAVLVGKDSILPRSSSVVIESIGITSGRSALKSRNVLLRSHVQPTPAVASDTILTVMSDPSGTDLLTADQRASFAAACESARRRADRFGGTYVPPPAKHFLDSKVVRMMQRSGAVADKGFATGFDVMAADEVAKRDARRHRFNLSMDYDTKTALAISDGATEDDVRQHQDQLARRVAKFGNMATLDLDAASAKVAADRVDIDMTLEARPDALHMYSLDTHFTRVRTKDILAYFKGYGPSYVEWTNDSSCTIVFHDSFTVTRALLALTWELPPSASTGVQSPLMAQEGKEEMMDGGKGWRVGREIGAADDHDMDRRTWRVLVRRATLRDFPPEKTWKRHQYHKSTHRRMQRPVANKRRRLEDDDGHGLDKRVRGDDDTME